MVSAPVPPVMVSTLEAEKLLVPLAMVTESLADPRSMLPLASALPRVTRSAPLCFTPA